MIRPAHKGDRKFIVVSWLDSFLASHDSGPAPNDIRREMYAEAIGRLLVRPSARLVVLCSEQSPDVVMSWLAWEPGGHHRHTRDAPPCLFPSLFYVYTRQEAPRRSGYANLLLKDEGLNLKQPFCFSYRTPAMRDATQGYTDQSGVFTPPWWGVRGRGGFDPKPYRFRETEHQRSNPL